jgi:Zn-dependent metalloprotease
MRCSIVPPYLLARIASLAGPVAPEVPELHRAPDAARQALAEVEPLHRGRQAATGRTAPTPAVPGAAVVHQPRRIISDAGNELALPGHTVRSEGEPATGDDAVDEAYDGLGATYRLLADEYGFPSIDGRGSPLRATVHYGRDYDNAFWNGERVVAGDGDGEVFERFTQSVTVLGHELAHGFTQHTTQLVYEGQSGALNEHVSDVVGALVEQHLLGQTAEDASWLIGAGILTPRIKAAALRSLKAPGTAYDDPLIGKDPQPAHMSDFVRTTEDNGGVHINSGIPNRAFYLAATALGGHAWERAGTVWFDALTGTKVPSDCSFARFAEATTAAASERFGAVSAEAGAVRTAWQETGVVP